MANIIQIRRDTAANWTSVNPVLHSGEIGFETDTYKVKMGTGTTAWNSLAYGGIVGPEGPAGPVGPEGPQGEEGPEGPSGPSGDPGIDGNTILSGTSSPFSYTGFEGDFYIDTSINYIYGPKTGAGGDPWNLGGGVSLVGPQGIQGENGNTVLNGDTAPDNSVGNTGDFYLDTVTYYLYGPKATGEGSLWWNVVELIGADGATGADGTSILSGTTAPGAGVGSDGDFYIDTTTSMLYGPKATTWPTGISLIGPEGPEGPDGPQGIQGIQGEDGPQGIQGIQGIQGNAGVDGKTVLSGTVDPTTEGVNGDFYINTTSDAIFGPKTGGAWGTGTSLVGPTGNTGSTGADGKTVLNGASDPTTQGVDGDFYINTTSDSIFGPKTSGAWGTGTSLVGPTGNTGAAGADAVVYYGTGSPPSATGLPDGALYIQYV